MLALAEWTSIGAWLSASETTSLRDKPIERFAAELLDRYRRRIKRGGRRLASLDDEERHELRILGKKLRYAAEFFSGLYTGKKAGRRRKRFLDALESLQSHLGDLNDEATGYELLIKLGVPAEQARATLGAAIDRKQLLSKAQDAYEELIDAKRFWR